MSDLMEKEEFNLQAALIKIATQKDLDPDRLEKFIDLQFKLEDKQNEKAFKSALANFQGDVPNIYKSKKVDFKSKTGSRTKYDYAPLEEIVETIKPHLQNHGLSFSFDIKIIANEKQRELITTVNHSSGHSRDFSYFFDPIHDDARMNMSQRSKSALSYAKRAALENALGLVTANEDDDARGTVKNLAPVSKADVEKVEALIKETNTKTEDFLKFMKLEKLSDMTEDSFKSAIVALNDKRSRNV